MYDNDADPITRPDIPAALVSGEEERASGFHPRVERELAPYTAVPVLTSRLNDPTVPDAALRVSMARGPRAEEQTPSGASVPPRSGTRQQLPSTTPPPAKAATTPPSGMASVPPPPAMASTVPPPGRARVQAPPAAASGALSDTRRERRPTTPVPTSDLRRERRPTTPVPTSDPRRERLSTTPLPASDTQRERVRSSPLPPAEPTNHLHAYVLVVGTAVAAAAIGIGLGNGSLGRFAERVRASWVESESAPPLATSQARPARPSATPSAVAEPTPPARSAVPDAAPKVPVLRIDQLPATEQASVAEPESTTVEPQRREPKRSRRVPHH